MHTLLQDLRYGIRMLRKNAGFTAVAVVSLGLGIGANTTIFSLIDAVFLTEITAVDPGRLVHVDVGRANQVSYPNYRDLSESKALRALAGFSRAEVSWQRGDAAEDVWAYLVTANFFDVLGVNAGTGRVFTAAEARPERDPQIVVISYTFWERRLGADPVALGSVLTLNNRPYTVIGVLPPRYRSVGDIGDSPDLYLPLSDLVFHGLMNRAQISVELAGRLAPGVTQRQARAALTLAAQRLEKMYPQQNSGFGRVSQVYTLSRADRFRQVASDPIVLFTGLLTIVVGLVLLIACANVAGLLLARATARRREIAIRLAIGASQRRLVQQLLTESLLLSALGAGLGLLLNLWLSALINKIQLPAPVQLNLQLVPDARLLLYAMVLTVCTTLLCGLLPAFQSARPDLVPALKQEEPRFSYRRLSLRNALVVGQVAVSLVLLMAASLFLRSLRAIAKVDPGFDVAHTLSVSVNFAPGRHTGTERFLFYERAIERLRAVPGVADASCAAIVPLSFNSSNWEVWIEGREQEGWISANLNSVGPGYFETMGIPLLRGREFETGDRDGAPLVGIINETFARRYFPHQDPIGQRLVERSAGSPSRQPGQGKERRVLEIVGVAQDSKYLRLGEDPAPLFYKPYRQPMAIRSRLALLVRTIGSPGAARAPVEEIIREMDPSAGVHVRTLADNVALSMFPGRIAAVLFSSLGGLGLVLAMVGLYGVMAYLVTCRVSEIGIRMALGASRTQVLRMVLADGLAMIGAGAGIGLVVSFLVTRPLAMFLAPGVGLQDPVSILGVTSVLALAGIGACLLPARRATLVDPVVALRYE